MVTLKLSDPLGIGAEFFRWEYAIAVAGAILKIDVFNQPNVQEAKDATKAVLDKIGAASGEPLPWSSKKENGIEAEVHTLLDQVKPGDYVAILAYIAPTPEHDRTLTAIRVAIRDRYRVATTVGYGPRYLHSTGQLHKGGPNTGVFLQLVGDDRRDLPIPGASYTFGALKHAQALGDLQALRQHQRRVTSVLIHDVEQGLNEVGKAVGATVGVA